MTVDSRSMNTLMRRLLATTKVRPDEIPPDLQEVLRLGVTGNSECLFLKALENTAGDYDPRAHFDRTGYECLINKVHIDPENTGDPMSLRGGLAFADALVETLKEARYQGPFRIILSLDCTQNICTVRFHRVRCGESWTSDDLESYLDEGLLVINCA